MKNIYLIFLIVGLTFSSIEGQQVVNLSHLKNHSGEFPEMYHVHDGPCEHRGPCRTMELQSDFVNMGAEKVESGNRPQYQGTELIATLDHFVFHYSLDGPADERIDGTDADLNGFPDYLEFMAFTFQDIADDYHYIREFPLPPHDGSEIDQAYYDIYIGNRIAGEGVYGFVQPEEKIGDNPATTLQEIESTTSWMAMRSDYTGFGPSQAFAIQVTAAHEYLHSIQFAYWLEMDQWLFEGSAAMIEEYKYPGLDDNFQYLEGIFKVPDAPFNLSQNELPQLGNHWYSTWSFWQFLMERTDMDFLKEVFEWGIDYYAFGAIDAALGAWDDNVTQAFVSYFIANALLTDDQDAAPFTYRRAADYRQAIQGVSVESVQEFSGVPLWHNSATHGNGFLMRTSCDYHYITSNQPFRVDAAFEQGADDVMFFLVKVDGNQTNISDVAVESLEWDGANYSTQVPDANQWDHYFLLCVRANYAATDLNSLQYEFVISPAGQTSVKDLSDEYDIIAYPTIVDDQLNVDWGNYSGTRNLTLTDNQGRQFSLNATGPISLSSFPSGAYHLIIFNGEESIIHKQKVIKK